MPALAGEGGDLLDAVLARRAERARAQQEEYQEQPRRAAEQKRAEREAARPACASCGTKCDDDGGDSPTLCEPFEAKAVAAAAWAERDRLEAEVAATAEKAGGWLSRFRERRLRAGELMCPPCGAVLAPQGHGRPREVRGDLGSRLSYILGVRTARWSGHACLLPEVVWPRRMDAPR
ncbi:hypothetical protein ACWCY1_27675 [Streptomyces goshikiensis]|uniref:hypothetical protein n=1 Tax=Streptomyces goshikiensis TaxID=1942 RepID=UPI0036DDCB79